MEYFPDVRKSLGWDLKPFWPRSRSIEAKKFNTYHNSRAAAVVHSRLLIKFDEFNLHLDASIHLSPDIFVRLINVCAITQDRLLTLSQIEKNKEMQARLEDIDGILILDPILILVDLNR